jgi:hypothetical protein
MAMSSDPRFNNMATILQCSQHNMRHFQEKQTSHQRSSNCKNLILPHLWMKKFYIGTSEVENGVKIL